MDFTCVINEDIDAFNDLSSSFASLNILTSKNIKLTAVYKVTSETSFELTCVKEKPCNEVQQSKVNFHDIGGLDSELEEIRSFLKVPLLSSELFLDFGFVPPKGLLLYGPPGTGKTLIAKAIANEMRVNFITINATEVLAKFYGQSEAKLRSVFHTAAQSSPCIIFIDEVDALCPKREHAETEVEKRVVTTMLSLLDSISNGEKQNCRVVVIGATNAPDRLDSALRRPGRFDREIEIGIPNSKQRLCILKRLLAKTPHTVSDSQLESISALMHGYVGADVSSLCKEAGLLAVKRTMCSTGEEDSAGLSDLVVTEADLRKALTLVRPSAMRAVVVDVPQVYWSDIGGQEDTKQKLREAVTWPLLHPEAFLRMGIRPPKGVLLYGPPGCSKTLLAKALATESQLNFISVKSSDLFSKWVGESEKAMKEFFRKARAASPCIIFFDELDAIAGKRGRDSGENSVADRVLTQLLNELDGVEPLKNVTFLAASNRPDAIDPALMRPGRIDRILFVAPPDESSRREIFTIHLKKMPNDLTDVEVDELARKTSFFSGAEIVAVCREAAMEALRRDNDTTCIRYSDFEKSLCSFQPQITESMMKYYLNYSTGRL